MKRRGARIIVLYSFPHKLGAEKICTTAWYQVDGLAKAGAEVLVFPGALSRPPPPGITIRPTLARGKVRIPYKVLGRMRALSLHDYIVSRRLETLVGQIDILHTWPLGALRTLKTAARLGIPTVLERPNAHTRFAYEVVQKECERLGVGLPPKHEHSYKADVLIKEEAEYELATRLLCPSDFVARSFLEHGFAREKLARHQYGFDEQVYYTEPGARQETGGLKMLFVGGCAPRKGVHYALEAWLKSIACLDGTFTSWGNSCGGMLKGVLRCYRIRPSFGGRIAVPQLMRQSDVLVLPSIEEGSALVTSEARGSGCVLMVSEAAGAICQHMENALVHCVGDVSALTHHMTLLHEDRTLLQRLRAASLRSVPEITWRAAGVKLLEVYRETIDAYGDTELIANGEQTNALAKPEILT